MARKDGDGDFRGINPQNLQGLINSIKNHTDDAGRGQPQRLVNGWVSEAGRIGLDTRPLSTVSKHYSWARGQLPMLRRRHSLAMNEEKSKNDHAGGKGWVGAGAGTLTGFKTQAEAAKAAKKDAKAYKDGKISYQEYLKRLQEHQFDPDYCKAAMQEIGDSRLYELVNYATQDHENRDQNLNALANCVANAMRGGFTLEKGNVYGTFPELAILLPRGNFPTDVLVGVGGVCLITGYQGATKYAWQALAANPDAATRFVHDHAKEIPLYAKKGGLWGETATNFAGVVRSGTIGGPGADPDMAADNTTTLINFYAANPNIHAYPEFDRVLAEDIKFYWGDLQATLTDPAPTNRGPGHVNVSSTAWESFIHESMQDPKAAAALLLYSREQANALADSDSRNPAAQQAAGIIEGTFGYQAVKVYKEKKSDGDDWRKSVGQAFQDAVSLGVDIALDPGAAAVTVGKKVIHEAADEFSKGIVNLAPKDTEGPPSTVTWRDNWTESAHQAYEENNNLGNPQQYADAFSGGKRFLTDDGQLVDHATPGQKEAYNQWLKDPAVAKALEDRYNARNDGRSTAMTGGH